MHLPPYSRTDCNPTFMYYVRQSASSIFTLPWGKTTPQNKKSVLWVRTHKVIYVTRCYLPREFAIVFATVTECPLLSIWILLHLGYCRHI